MSLSSTQDYGECNLYFIGLGDHFPVSRKTCERYDKPLNLSIRLFMQLEFVPVEDFYFALTLCCRTLEDFGDREMANRIQQELAAKYGQSSTVAAAKQNNFNYTFKVTGIDNAPSDQLVISVADWQDKIRLSSDYGWILNEDRKPTRTDKFDSRNQFCADLKAFLRETLNLSLPDHSSS